jgi:hypothetical protein
MLERLSFFDAELHFKVLSPGDVTHGGNETRRLVSGHAGIASDHCMPALTEWDSNQDQQLPQSPSQTADSVSGKVHNDQRDDTANDNGYDDDGDDADDVQPLNIWEDQLEPSEMDAACLEELAASLSTCTSDDNMHDNLLRSNHVLRLSAANSTRASTIQYHRSTAYFEFGQEEY